jgi:hypothetical protein
MNNEYPGGGGGCSITGIAYPATNQNTFYINQPGSQEFLRRLRLNTSLAATMVRWC